MEGESNRKVCVISCEMMGEKLHKANERKKTKVTLQITAKKDKNTPNFKQ